ncbi:tetraspanin-9-like [Centruroides sculpturatus]|uniref:tetraspanin-9-like n=1 Tax=Centruroides sculpturatus TaxID=218467 RepID=UPI000C6ED784|nr:tetraspanin-9-like [Centruroides sculpturatus]XP_023244788.1 tetraspanin-9-like [Centruroides sculpturatus]XP_023244789.1 tetraspanin-9-like [Centruroides sculpturatus]XP_023244790.1 tetraspanin-9-like [Centruroides sculpturatus]XP_023244791.1 tetraspanin-9-like [Centruroides sculpturatus]
MKMGRSGYTCIRHSLCIINLLFWVVGCGMLGIGIWLHIVYGGYATLLPSYQIISAGSLSIASGIITFIVGFLGCCGSWFQNKCLLVSYFILVILIFLLEFTAGTLGFIYRKHVGETLRDELLMGIQEKYKVNDVNGLTEAWDHIQLKFECCGVNGINDWYNINAWPEKTWVPTSCCIEAYKNETCGMRNETEIWHNQGCYQRMHMWLMEQLYIVAIICMLFAFIQLFGLISAMLLVCRINEKRYER